MQNFEVISMAMCYAKQTGNESALIRANDAEWFEKHNEMGCAYGAAMESLKHSIGVFHADYKKARG